MSLINTSECDDILDLYDEVATGETLGASGYFYADGKGTLNAVVVPVAMLEKLAKACGRKLHPRTRDYRKS